MYGHPGLPNLVCTIEIPIKTQSCPDWVAQLVVMSTHTPKGCRFNSPSVYIPRLQVWSPVRAHMRGNQSRSLCLSHSVLISLKSIKISSGEDFFKKQCFFLNISPPKLLSPHCPQLGYITIPKQNNAHCYGGAWVMCSLLEMTEYGKFNLIQII